MSNRTRSGKMTSLQFGNWGRITGLDSGDFSLSGDTPFLPNNEGNIPFLICNESDEDVFLDVVNTEGKLIENARFRPGYDPKLVTVIKQNGSLPAGVSLLWGN